MHEMEEFKRAQELRVDEVSVQKLRENHESIQQLTSRLSRVSSAATKDCRLTHGINLDNRKTFLETKFLRSIHPEIILKEFNLTTSKETKKQSLKPEGRRLFTQVKTD